MCISVVAWMPSPPTGRIVHTSAAAMPLCRPAAAPKPARAPKVARRAYDPSSILQQQPDEPMDMHDDIPEAPAQAMEDMHEDAPQPVAAQDLPDPTDNKTESPSVPNTAASAAKDKPHAPQALAIPTDVLEMPTASPDDDDQDAEDEMEGVEEGEADEAQADAQQTDLKSGNTLEFFFLDAHYEPHHVGRVLLIGKVNGKKRGEYIPACVRVQDMKQCLFVIPKPFVFQDTEGDIHRCAFESQSLGLQI